MKRLLRLLRWRAQVRYWHRRAAKAEAEVGLLKLRLSAERWRNMQREDTFASAAVLGSRNMWGLAPRTGPALQETPKQPVPQPNPYALSGPDLMEYELEWKPLADAQGVSDTEAKRQFMLELERRRGNKLQDDPYSTTN